MSPSKANECAMLGIAMKCNKSRIMKNFMVFSWHRSGFTLIELVVVLILLGVISAVALSRYSNVNSPSASDIETLKSSTRQAQMRAMGDIASANWKIIVSNSSVSIQNGASVVATTNLNDSTIAFTIVFDNRGRVSSSTGTVPFGVDTETGFIK